MRKFIAYIIIFVSFFSISNFVNASSDGLMSDILKLNYGIQESDIKAITTKDITLRSLTYQNMYNQFKELDKSIKNEIFKKIKNSELDYYTGFGVLKSYKNFVYSVNKLFDLYKLKESGSKDYLLDSNIRNTYFEIRTHYKRVQYLVNK
nr:hypothetical protein [Candidatus Gracilibacteria bacterium]